MRPSAAELRALSERMTTATPTRYGSLNVRTRVRRRAIGATYVVTDHPGPAHGPCLDSEAGASLARLQDDYAATRDMVVVDGHLGRTGACRAPARLVVERANANIAAMQRHLYIDPVSGAAPFAPALTVIDTPNLAVPGFPGGRVVAVWLDEGITRIAGTDYFDEAKKAGLRMWAARVELAGGLLLHAGCTVVPTGAGPRSMLLVGRSGAGKTTLTFSCPGGQLVQDDFMALFPGGRLVPSEDGCIEKTYRLEAARQPVIHAEATSPGTYLENVPQRGPEPDFADPAGERGRAVFSLGGVRRWPPAVEVPPAALLCLLHPADTVVPAVARLTPEQAATWLLLRELGGPAGRPGAAGATTPARQVDHAARLVELLRGARIQAYLLNTGRVGGPRGDDHALPVRLEHSRAIVAAVAAGTLDWEPDPDFGWQVAVEVPGVEPELLQPRRLYRRRRADHRQHLERFATATARFLGGFPGLDPALAGVLERPPRA